ncbi:MAG: ribose-5-phosphate isomerase RpiA [Gammaproteobacteria bacterium]|nr:ribose-5-phosphate isomerase RpiA [Gammaproteobacteria bacterium]
MARIEPLLHRDCVLGVGTGSTANFFIDALAGFRDRFYAAVSSSAASTARLEGCGIRVLDLNDVDTIAVYVDGADEVDPGRALTKGGGGALTREKIVASAAARFLCIVDDSKMVDVLGTFPLPVEVIPMARRTVERTLAALGGQPRHRSGFVTDNGNDIVDVHGLAIPDPSSLEAEINAIPGVVENGLFARETRPEAVLVGTPNGVELRE